MTARDMPYTRTKTAMRKAATEREPVRIRGTIVATGGGYSGPYKNVWLLVSTAAGRIQVTAGTKSPLGTMAVGTRVDLAAQLTGMYDLSADTYYASHARLITSGADTSQRDRSRAM